MRPTEQDLSQRERYTVLLLIKCVFDGIERTFHNDMNYACGVVMARQTENCAPIKIRRGLNALWDKGGLQYAPPIR
jgi:hypothetical protein